MIENLRTLGRLGNLNPTALDRVVARLRRPADRIYEARATRLADLARLAPPAGQPPGPGPRVLVVSLRGWSAHSACEVLIAHALRLRGARVGLLRCGGGMPACEVGWARRAYPRPCDRCAWLTARLAEQSGLEQFALRDFLAWGGDARRAPGAVTPAHPADDPYALSRVSLTWLMRATQVDRVPDGPSAREDFAVASDGVRRATEAILDRFEPDIVFLLNGLFAAENSIRQVASRRGLRTPTYEIAPRAGCLVLSQQTPAPFYDTDALWGAVRETPLSPAQRAQVSALLEGRAQGVGAHERYFDDPETDASALRRRLGLSGDLRVVSLFTNVSWDSATFARDVGFTSMMDWIVEATRRAAEHPGLVLVIRIHPGEELWGTRERVEPELLSAVGRLPANVRIVPATEPLSSYALLEQSDLVLTYTTTVGLEAACRGKAVAVAGETHYRRRGFTTDLDGPADLASVLADPPEALDDARVELALRYAFAFFFRAMVPFPAMQGGPAGVTRVPTSEEELRPGTDPYLDWICDRILDGADFALPDELAAPVPALVSA